MKKILLFLVVMVFAFQNWVQGQITVNGGGSYSTIQAAVDAASSNDIITVPAGNYTENVNVNKSLTILGPNETISPNGGTRVSEAIVYPSSNSNYVFTVNTVGISVTIRGFEIHDGEPLTDGRNTSITSNKPNVVFEKNKVINGRLLYGGYIWNNITITDNYFFNNAGVILDNTRDAIYILSGNSIAITDNVIENTLLGILVKGDSPPTTTGGAQIAQNVSILRNKIIKTLSEGIQVGFNLGTVDIRQNEIDQSGKTPNKDDGGIKIYEPNNSGTITIEQNLITNSDIGLKIMQLPNTIGYVLNNRIVVTNNSFGLTNDLAIRNDVTGQLKAECNWLGSDCPPPTRVIGDVDYTPWLISGIDNSAEIGFQGNNVCSSGSLNATKSLEQSPACFGGTGSVTITISGCTTPPYTYQILTGPIINVTSNPFTISGLAPRTSTIYIRDAAGRSFDISVTIKSAPSAINVNTTSTNASCAGGNTGSVTLVASGGTPGYLYTIKNTGTNTTYGPQSSGVFNSIPAGNYSFSVTDANSCDKTGTFTIGTSSGITFISAAVTSDYNGAQVSCVGSKDGKIEIKASGTTGLSPYSLSGGTLSSTATNNSGIFTNLGAGTYVYVIENKNGCPNIFGSLEIKDPLPIMATGTKTADPTCTSSSGQITIIASGGTGPLNYTLTAVGGSASSPQSSGKFSNLSPGSYSYTVTDANNCIFKSVTNIVIEAPTGCTSTCTFEKNSTYYGGFEAGSASFSPTTAGSDLKHGLPAKGTYQVVKNVSELGGGGYLNVTPRTGNYFLAAHTSNNGSDKTWFSTRKLPAGNYKFCAYVRLLKNLGNGAVFTVGLFANGEQIGTVRVTDSWTEVCGTYNSNGGDVTFSINDTKKGLFFLAIDDICLSPAATTSAANREWMPGEIVMAPEGDKVVVPVETSLEVKVLSNPSSTFFQLQINGTNENVVIDVIDQLGRKVQTLNTKANTNLTIGREFSIGTYYAVITQGTKKRVIKLVKIR